MDRLKHQPFVLGLKQDISLLAFTQSANSLIKIKNDILCAVM